MNSSYYSSKENKLFISDPVVCEVFVNDGLITLFSKLSMAVMVHVKDGMDLCHVPCKFVSLSSEGIVLESVWLLNLYNPFVQLKQNFYVYWLILKMKANNHAPQKI